METVIDSEPRAVCQKELPNDAAQSSEGGLPKRFLSFFSFVIVGLSIIHNTLALVLYIMGYAWTRMPVEHLLGIYIGKPATSADPTILAWHACTGMFFSYLILLQVGVTIYFPESTTSWLRRVHRATGHVIVLGWAAVVVLGAVVTYSLNSKPWGPISVKVVAAAFAYSTGIGTLGNMLVGYLAILKWKRCSDDDKKSDKGKDRMLLHKVAMYFSLHWLFVPGLNAFLTTVLQLAFRHCRMGTAGFALVSFFGELACFLIVVGVMLYWQPQLVWNKPMLVKINLIFLLIKIPSTFMGAIVTMRSEDLPDDSCFAR